MGGDQLPSWHEGPAKRSVVEFVSAVTDPGSADFAAEPERIAVFDNDGTLWTEQPVYAQLAFALDRAAELGHPVSLEQRPRSRVPSTPTSGSARSWPPGTPTATWPCSSGPRPARTGPCSWWYATPTAIASMPTTVTPYWAAGLARSMPPPSRAGP